MRNRSLLVALACVAAARSALAQPVAAAFHREIRPLLKQYCVGCHSAARHAGDMNLEQFTSFADVRKNPTPWQKAVEQLSLGEMPPKVAPQPSVAERERLIAWANEALQAAARARAGDPGPVVLRRLNNAEYTFTIRDLTAVPSLDPAKEFPADGAAGEGFMNTGAALVMSPSLISKYLEAGKSVAAHTVLLPDGIRFSPSTSRRDWTDDLLAQIRAFYAEFTEAGGADTVTQQGIALDKNRGGALPLRKYLAASLELRAPGPIESVARKHRLSAKYLRLLVSLLSSSSPSPILDPLRKQWRAAAKPEDIDAIVREIARWQEAVWKFSSVGHIGKVDGPKAWMEPVTPIVEQQEFRLKLQAPASGNEVSVYLAAYDAGDGQAGDFVLWREPKLAIPGRPPVLLRDLPALVDALAARRERVFADTAHALKAAAGANPPSSEDDKAWFAFLGTGAPTDYKLDLLAKKIEKSRTYEFVQGWGTLQTPMLLANSSNQHVRVPGSLKPHGVAVHPSETRYAAVGWRSSISATLRIDGTLMRAHAECGNGVTWSVELRRGSTRQRLAEGEARNAAPVAIGPFERVRVHPGDLISVLVGPREANHSCDLTDLEFRVTSLGPGGAQWSLTDDVAGKVLAGNPHGVWHFYTEPVAAVADTVSVLPSGSLLARWQAAERNDEKQQLAHRLEALLTGPAPPSNDRSPDALLYRQLSSLAGPLLAGVTAPAAVAGAGKSRWGLERAQFGRHPNGAAIDAASVCVRAPALLEVRLPADLVANSEFVVTAGLTKQPARKARFSWKWPQSSHRPAPAC